MNAHAENQDDHVAIIGMAGRFPGARDVHEFWDNLANGVESISFPDDDELRSLGVSEAKLSNPNYVKAVPRLDDVETFDARFFGFTPREAEIRDPQNRLFLETAYSALEHAGVDVARYPGLVGVFGGTATNRYAGEHVRANRAAYQTVGDLPIEISNNADYLATTVSYKLGLRGPSLTVATACSTSLVAVHLADQALRNGECDLALAGAVEVEMPHGAGYLWSEGSIFSRDGHCRAFDAKASGTIFGTGVGVVVLKRLADAVTDGDEIYAVIRGTAVNNDGSQRAGFTAPGAEGQQALVTEALAVAEVHPSTVTYVEAHGTGTLVGDPIEVSGLTAAFRAAGAEGTGYCAIGSVKSNVGHLGPAAGVAGLIKTALAMHHGLLPASLHFEEPNPGIDFASSPFFVNTTLRPWATNGRPRRAGVSSFGIGGTNAHVVLEEAPARPASGPARPWQLLPLAAKSPGALDAIGANLARHLERHPDQPIADVAHTLQVGRAGHERRRALVSRSTGEAAALLDKGGRRLVSGDEPARARPVAFAFPGQGAQHVDMARELWETEAAFCAEVDRCAELLLPSLELDLRTLLFPAADGMERAAGLLDQTRFTQPALFTVEFALARLWASWGVEPAAMLGHSIGEYVAACLAGVLTVEDALKLVAARGALMQDLPAGAMLAVPVAEQYLRPLLGEDVALAAVNAPDLCVVSGPHAAVDGLEELLGGQGVQCRRLHTTRAFHSPMMDPAVEPFRALVAGTALRPPSIPFVSNLTGTWITAEQATDPGYWAAHLRQAVRFSDGLATLLADPDRVLLEVGPGQTVTTVARRQPPVAAGERVVVASMRHPKQQESDMAALLGALGRLWVAGVEVDWAGLHGDERRRRIALPTYPFERRRYWIDPDPERAGEGAAEPEYVVRRGVDDALFEPVWREARLDPAPGGALPHGEWLVFTPGDGVVDQLAERLAAAGAEVRTVVPSASFAELEPGRYGLRPSEREDYDALLEAIAASGSLPTGIVHGWTAGPPADEPVSPEAVRAAQDLGFFSVLHLAQAIAKHYGSTEATLTVVSSNLQDVTGQDVIEPGKATVLGLCKLVPKELPNIACHSVDVRRPSAQPDHLVAGQLLEELVAQPGDRQVAYRGHKRWIWSFESIRVPPVEGVPGLLRERGIYLVTGGLGGIGLALAEDLARQVRARLVLLGRSEFPVRDEWDRYLGEHDEADRTSRRIRQLQAVEDLGGEVLVLRADVANEEQLRAAVDRATATFGGIDGVFHAAGVGGGGMLAVKTRQDAERVLAPKVAGTVLLDRLLGDRVDFLVLFSSIVAIAGDYGLTDYCAANNFLDAFAHARAGDDRFVVAIDWAAWRQFGMAEEAESAAPLVFRELQGGTRYEPSDHPLLDRRVLDSTGDIVFSTVLEPDSHWVLTEHRIEPHAILPGTAYVELVRAAFAEAMGSEVVEIRDLVLMGPLKVEGRREVRTMIRRAGDDAWEFTVASSAVASDADGWGEHAKGRVRAVADAGPAPLHDLDAIRRACDAGRLEPQSNDGTGLVTVGPRWNNISVQWLGRDQELALLELPAAFEDDRGRYGLHPALFDGATSFAQHLPDVDGHYLPFSYGKVTIRAPLPPRCYTHIRHLDERKGEILSCDITVMDEQGTELVEVQGFAVRRVDADALLAGLSAGDGEQAPTSRVGIQPEEVNTELDFGIQPEEALEALRRILASRTGPQVVMCPEGVDHKIKRMESLTQDLITETLSNVQLGGGVATPRSLDTPYVAPATELERTLADFWQQALGVSEVGVEDDFFELGGDSLVAVQLGARIRDHLQIELPIASMFESPNVRSLAAAIERSMLKLVESLSEAEAAAMLAGEPEARR